MTDHATPPSNFIYPIGTQVVTLRNLTGEGGRILQARGSVGVVIRSPADLNHSYRVRFLDGSEESLRRDDFVALSHFNSGEIGNVDITSARSDLFSRVIFRCVIGSRAYGLETESSDTDYRGVYLPAADPHWSLFGVPDQIEREATQEHYWEVERFLVLALKANPNVLECLYTPLVEHVTPLGQELLDMRSSFLSQLVFQTHNGYVASQFKKMQADLRNQGQVKWKHVMHLLRLLIAGIDVLRHGHVPVRVETHRKQLLAVKRGEMPWAETERWRQVLHQEFAVAVRQTKLPERPDYDRANTLLIKARRAAMAEELP